MFDRKIKGKKTTYLFYPIIILIIFFQVIIVVNTIITNVNTAAVSKESKRQSDINYDLARMLASTSKLSDIAINFSHEPIERMISNDYRLNSESLVVYLDEISLMDIDTTVIRKSIDKYDISDEAMAGVNELLDSFSILLNYHARAFTLIDYALRNEYIKDIDMLKEVISYLPKYELTQDELLYTKEEAIKIGFDSLFTMEYAVNKGNLSIYVDKIMNQIISDSATKVSANQKTISVARYVQWYSVGSIAILTILFIIAFIIDMIKPIINFSRKINRNEKLDIDGKLYEINVLAYAYNELIDRHIEYEKDLKNVAERDSLTGLPNRYSYNEFLKKEIVDSFSACVFMLDLNELKYVNDTFGHSEGDKLIESASSCIKDVFKDGNCYRIGGDEFLVVLTNIDENSIEEYIKDFELKQKKYKVSIAMGYAYSNDIKKIGYEKLSKIADEMMYENKRKFKEEKIKNRL